MNKNCIIETRDHAYEFVSKNGIHYELLHGVSVGNKAVSETLFVMLNVFIESLDVEDEFFWEFGGTRKMITFFQSPWANGDESDKESTETWIASAVADYEKVNKKMIDYILSNNIKTSPYDDEKRR